MMKIIFQDIGNLAYRPRFKCGVGLGIGAAVGAIGSSIIGSATSSSNVSSQLGAQAGENALNRAWQTQEAEKARQYNTSERLATQDYQQQLIDKMNQYASPQHQAAMYRQAGMNPNIALGGSGTIASASPSASQAGNSPTPSGVGGLSPVGYQPLDLQIPQLLNGIGGFMKNMGEANRLGVDTDMAKALFDTNIKLKQGELSRQELYNTGLELDNIIKRATKDTTILRAEEEYKKAVWDAVLAEQKGISEQLQQDVLRSQEKLNQALERYNGQNAELLKMQVANYQDIVNMQLNIGKSEVVKNYADASKSTEDAKYQNMVNNLKDASMSAELKTMLSSYASQSAENKAKVQEFNRMFDRFKKLNENNKNAGADYMDHLFWYIKEQMPSLPIVPFLKLGK